MTGSLRGTFNKSSPCFFLPDIVFDTKITLSENETSFTGQNGGRLQNFKVLGDYIGCQNF